MPADKRPRIPGRSHPGDWEAIEAIECLDIASGALAQYHVVEDSVHQQVKEPRIKCRYNPELGVQNRRSRAGRNRANHVPGVWLLGICRQSWQPYMSGMFFFLCRPSRCRPFVSQVPGYSGTEPGTKPEALQYVDQRVF